ncbi:MAG TPA: hypothetical protein VEM36_09385 [Xanthobacteraceae bacterium]|nr:hypothetical protein [Xanthobacteraceae bacterium]
MFTTFRTVALVALFAGSASAALAHEQSGQSGRHARVLAHQSDARVSAPPRMIEIRPGLFVGSYQCVYAGGRSCDSGI